MGGGHWTASVPDVQACGRHRIGFFAPVTQARRGCELGPDIRLAFEEPMVLAENEIALATMMRRRMRAAEARRDDAQAQFVALQQESRASSLP